jgi:hypothetical protein
LINTQYLPTTVVTQFENKQGFGASSTVLLVKKGPTWYGEREFVISAWGRVVRSLGRFPTLVEHAIENAETENALLLFT